MDFNNELWSSESYSQLVLILWILIYVMVCTFPILFLIAAAIASDRRLNSITNLPNFENEKKLILKPEMVRGELQFDHSLGLSSDAVSYLKHESEECDSETNPKQVISSKDEHDSIQNQFNSPKSEQRFKENNVVRAELQCEDLLNFNTDSVSRPHFMNDFEWGNSERNSNHVIRIPDEIAVYSGNTKDRCPKPASLKYLDSDSSASISSWNFSPCVSWDSFADVSSDDDFVGIHKDGLDMKLSTHTDILEAENDHDMSLHQHKFEEEENKESSSGIKKDHPPISNSEDNIALKGSWRGNEVELKSRKEKQTNVNPSMGTVLSESLSSSLHESEECDSETNPKQVISSKDEHDSIQNQFNSPKSEQRFKENNVVRAELQCEDLLNFNTDSVSRPHFMNDCEWGNPERNSNHVIRMPNEIAVHSGNTKDRCPKPASLKCEDSDSSAYVSSWNFSPRVSWDSFVDVSSDNDFVGILEDGLYIELCNDPHADILEAENDHNMSLHQHKFEEEENKESSGGIRKGRPPISDSEHNSALNGSRRGNEVELKSRKQKQTNVDPGMGTVLSESLSHPQQPTVDAEDKKYKNPGNFSMRKLMPKHPDYALLLSRVSSFAGWPTYLDQTPQMMAEAGFFYTGSEDYTRCFQCGGGLRILEPGDDPWIEHARWYPQCPYVLVKRGQKFVNAVLKKQAEQNTPLAFQNAQRSESSSTTTISTIRRRGTAINLEFDSSQESGSQSGRQETTIEQESLLPDEGRGSIPWRQSNSATGSATMDELIETRRLFTVNEDNTPLPLPTGIPTTTTTTESNQSRLNISNSMKSTVNLTSSPSFGNHGASQNTEAAKSPSSLP